MGIPVILDTDIGSDVDDLLALAQIVNTPNIDLLGVTCVYGDVGIRAKIAMKLLKYAGRESVPVHKGSSEPLLKLKPVWWAGYEGQELTPEDHARNPVDGDAVEYIVRTVLNSSSKVSLISIGPLTNIAKALLRSPQIVNHLEEIIIMGGAHRGLNGFELPYCEHNIACDPEAAHIVFTSAVKKKIVPIDVTSRVHVHRHDVKKIRGMRTSFHDMIADAIEQYPTYKKLGFTYLNDPLAAVAASHPEFLEFTALHVDIELEGLYSKGATLMRKITADHPYTADVALKVYKENYEMFFLDTICRPLT